MGINLNKLLDKSHEDKGIAEVLKEPPSALAGLTERHDAALADLGIKSIGDLGRWKYAKAAAALVHLADHEE